MVLSPQRGARFLSIDAMSIIFARRRAHFLTIEAMSINFASKPCAFRFQAALEPTAMSCNDTVKTPFKLFSVLERVTWPEYRPERPRIS